MTGSLFKEYEIVIREIINNGKVIFTAHAKERMGIRGYTTHDVFHILSYGSVKNVTDKGNDKCVFKIQGNDIEGDEGIIIIEIRKKAKMIIITVM